MVRLLLDLLAGPPAAMYVLELSSYQLETITGFQGTSGIYNMSATVHQGITVNPFLIAMIINGKVKVVQ